MSSQFITGERYRATLGEVQNFMTQGIEQYGLVTEGEEEAKKANILALVTDGNVALIGVPGGNKSELSEASHLIVDGIEEGRIAVIPNQADLRPERVLGAHVDVERTTNGHLETISTDMPPLIKPDTQKLYIDEATRINPHALGAILELIRKRKVMTTAGILAVPDLVIVNATLNPSETRQATFAIADAFASRFPIAAVMGVRNRSTTEKIMGGMEPAPENIKPIVTLDELELIRKYIQSPRTAMDSSMQSRGVDLVERMTDTLARSFNFHEADGRMAFQMRKNARALAALHGRVGVSEEDVNLAAKFIFTARLGMAGLRGSALHVNDIHGAATELIK